MTWVVPLALGGLAVVLMAVFTMLGARRKHHAMGAPAKVVGPAVLIHDINDDRCTGCDACVAVCPTNVLDLVSNKSRVLRFQDCIQCEACMYACPTEALVMFPEGAVPPPLKVPEIDENFQTVVPGQYLIGEVAGKPLVKNAANLGRLVVEHMLTSGMRVGALGRSDTTFDVVIVGSGPGGISAALTCVQRGLSYVMLEKEQEIASTISRYPKGKLVMAEPYDTINYSLLPVFDSSKEALIPIWKELIDRIGLSIKLGESVEGVVRGGDGAFETRTTVGMYRSQKVILSIGTRGKPRTLQVPGENLPKIFSLLDDPDVWNGRAVLVVGGGDSAVEAALALSDAGARVMVSYRGKGFQRAAPKNKQTIEAYAAEGRIKAKLGSQVLAFDPESVTLALADGSQKKYPNDATFVLIGADPPVQWLEKMGVKFVERPHQYQTGKTDDLVQRLVPRAIECPEDAARAAAQVLGGTVGPAPVKQPVRMPTAAQAVMMPGAPMPMGEPMSGPRKWLRSATSIFSNKLGTNPGIASRDRSRVERTGAPQTNAPVASPGVAPVQTREPHPNEPVPRKKKFDAPVPLSEFAKRQKSTVGHSGNGRRDQLTAGERTRILRMLRDEGGRMADEDSQVYIGAAPPGPNDAFDFDDSPAPAPAPAPAGGAPRHIPMPGSAMAARGPKSAQSPSPSPMRGDVPAKPAVVVGIAKAREKAKSGSGAGRRTQGPASSPGPSVSGRRPGLPPPFAEEPTRQVDGDMLAQLRVGNNPQPSAPVTLDNLELEDSTRPGDLAALGGPGSASAGHAPLHLAPNLLDIEDHSAHDEATKMESLESLAAMERAARASQRQVQPGPGQPPQAPAPAASRSNRMAQARPPLANGNEERTRAVDIRNDRSISDVDWDLD
nr:NAD(P)-binding domain-containing protein [Kofleriaceae bacterium]